MPDFVKVSHDLIPLSTIRDYDNEKPLMRKGQQITLDGKLVFVVPFRKLFEIGEKLGIQNPCDSQPTVTKVSTQFIYTIRQGDTRLIKIGFSKNLHQRMESLQIANAMPLYLIYAWEIENAQQIEKKLHMIFIGKRLKGEWFYLSQKNENKLVRTMKDFGGKSLPRLNGQVEL